MKKSKLSKIIKESLKGIIKEQGGCNSYQNRTPGDFSQPGPSDACSAGVVAIRCSDIPSSYTYTLQDLQAGANGMNSQICNDLPNKCYDATGSKVKIQGSNLANPWTPNNNCEFGWTPVVGDHMLSQNSGGGPAYVAWLIVSANHGAQSYCGGPRREWFNCTPGWTSNGCLEPGMPLYSNTHTADCAGNPIPNAAGPFGDTSCCGLFGCTDPAASNYDPNATTDDGSCVYDVQGCLSPSGGNGTCFTPPSGVGAWYAGLMYENGVLNNDCAPGNMPPAGQSSCGDGVTTNDGSCIPVVYGCTDQNAINYYVGACIPDPASCLFWGCNDSNAFNYDPQAAICDTAIHPYPPGTGCCEYDGCNDPIASNYNPVATGCVDSNGNIDPNDTSCCDYTATRKCDEQAWKAHVWQNYSQLNGDPSWQLHFCEYCSQGIINPLQEPWCKCCEPEDPCEDFNNASSAMQQGCCDKCQMMGGTLPPNTQCHTLTNNCDCCETDPGGGDERGCMDPNAINNGECCPQNNYPGCVATIQYDECCKYEVDPPPGPERGCITPQDPTMTVINIGTCCPQTTYPGCIPTVHYEECCDYQEPTGESFGTNHDTLQEIFKRRAGIIPNR